MLLIGLLASGAVLYASTYAVTRAFRTREQQLAENWYGRGTGELRSGHPEDAIADFRSALLYRPAEARYRLSLAQALMARGRYDQAGAYFLSLLESEPGDGLINLQLARLAVLRRDLADAQRFFHGAIYGIWDEDPDANRRQARLELIDFLSRASPARAARFQDSGSAVTAMRIYAIPPIAARIVIAEITAAGAGRHRIAPGSMVGNAQPSE